MKFLGLCNRKAFKFFIVLPNNLTVNKLSVKLLSINSQFHTLGLISDHKIKFINFHIRTTFIESIYQEFEMTVFFILEIICEALHVM